VTIERFLARCPIAIVIGLAASLPCQGADASDADIAALKRAIEELRAENAKLADRVTTLEGEKTTRESTARSAPVSGAPAAAGAVASPASPQSGVDDLARRVKVLEVSKIAQEDATRAIIRDTVSTLGSKINESVALGGAIELLAERRRDFSGVRQSNLLLNTAELDLEIKANPWAVGNLKIAYEDGSGVQFTDTRGFESGVDRFTVDTASVTIGDVQRFPLFLKFGRTNLAFGSSTGVHRSDVLSIDSPLTTDAFEMKRTAIGIGFGLPTPALTREAPPVVVPPVRPLVLAPLIGALGTRLGYAPPPVRPKPASPVSLPPEPPPFYGILNFYEGNHDGKQRSFFRNVNARLGYRAGGHCGKPYAELSGSNFCPWSLDFNVDYNTSVFDSAFLETEYRRFLDTIGPVRGMASTLKMSLGPWLVVGEWNGATEHAVFEDDAGTIKRIRPSAWQLALGYQFDWNPWVETIGGQGTYVALGYSRSADLAGAIQLVGNAPSRVGSLPRSRWTLTAGEWVLEGLKVQLEYSRIKDYAIGDGGTGATGSGAAMTLTYSW
jgi:hypothetical protein